MIIGSSSGMIDIGRDDGATASDFVAHELGGDFIGMAAPKLWPRCWRAATVTQVFAQFL